MTAPPRIETADPEQALTLCRDLLAFLEATAYDLTEDAAVESSDAVYTSVTIWNGVCLLLLVDMCTRPKAVEDDGLDTAPLASSATEVSWFCMAACAGQIW